MTPFLCELERRHPIAFAIGGALIITAVVLLATAT